MIWCLVFHLHGLQQGQVGSCEVHRASKAQISCDDQRMQPELGVLVQNEHTAVPADDILPLPAHKQRCSCAVAQQ